MDAECFSIPDCAKHLNFSENIIFYPENFEFNLENKNSHTENNIPKIDRQVISDKIKIIEDMYKELVSYLNFELTNISDCNIYCFENAERIFTELMFRFNIVKGQLMNFNIYLKSVIRNI